MSLFPQIKGLRATINLMLAPYEIKVDEAGALNATLRPCPESWRSIPVNWLPDVHATAVRALYLKEGAGEPEGFILRGEYKCLAQLAQYLISEGVDTFEDLWRHISGRDDDEATGLLTMLNSVADFDKEIDDFLLLALEYVLHHQPHEVTPGV